MLSFLSTLNEILAAARSQVAMNKKHRKMGWQGKKSGSGRNQKVRFGYVVLSMIYYSIVKIEAKKL